MARDVEIFVAFAKLSADLPSAESIGHKAMTFTKAFTGVLAIAALFAAAGSAEAARKKSVQPETIGEYMHDARVERGYVCYSDHFHYGSSSGQATRKQAEAAAISSWASFVDLEYGSAWASYKKAGSRKMTCSQGSGGWECSVEARPCRS